jgi:hypothetical protein
MVTGFSRGSLVAGVVAEVFLLGLGVGEVVYWYVVLFGIFLYYGGAGIL